MSFTTAPVRGMTIVELMVALTLGLLLLVGLATLFVSTNRSYRQNDLIAGMQDQARFGLSTLSRDLSMAGYWGGMLGTANIVPNLADTDTTNDTSTATGGLAPGNDCGPAGVAWAFNLSARAEFRNQDDPRTVASMWNCIGHHVAGTDVVAIRRVAGQLTGSMAATDSSVKLRPYQFYLETNSTIGTMIRWGATAQASPSATDQPNLPPMSFFRYYPRIYYVRDFSRTVGDGTPTLCRKELCPSGFVSNGDPELNTCGAAGAPLSSAGFYPECVAEGVEDFQVVWGLDSTADADDVVDRYTSTPNATEMATQARTAEITLLVRSRKADPAHRDDKLYKVGDKSPWMPGTVVDPAGTPGDQLTRNFYRRTYSTTVQLRNPLD